jgi:hypothetical protein
MIHLVEQLELDLARAEGHAAAERAANAAPPGWARAAAVSLWAAARLLRENGRDRFTIEELRSMMAWTVPRPPDLRAWGHATRIAVASDWLRQIHRDHGSAVSSNGSLKPVYSIGPKIPLDD